MYRTISGDEGTASRESTSAKSTLSGLVLFLYPLFLAGSALDAYSVGSLSIPWIARIGIFSTTLIVGFSRRLVVVPGTKMLIAFFLWGGLVTILGVLHADYAEFLPPLATSSYPAFVLLRLLVVLSVIATVYLAYWLLRRGHHDAMIRWTVLVGTLIAVAAIYIYFAQLHNLPEPPRNRIGTSGAEQVTRFSYAFHRAMGTFREPSHLAEWLVVPFFLSLSYRQKGLVNLHSVVIASALLLTGSLTGIVSVPLGFLGSMVLVRLSARQRLRSLASFIAVGLLAVVIFSAIVSGYDLEPNLLQVVENRLTPILFEGGLSQSNRSHVYEYVQAVPFPTVGAGFGNANLLLSHYLATDTVASFLSLYLATLYSTGMTGLMLLGLFLVAPVLAVFRRSRPGYERWIRVNQAAYLACLIMFAVNSEELHLMFAIVYALLTFEVYVRRSAAPVP